MNQKTNILKKVLSNFRFYFTAFLLLFICISFVVGGFWHIKEDGKMVVNVPILDVIFKAIFIMFICTTVVFVLSFLFTIRAELMKYTKDYRKNKITIKECLSGTYDFAKGEEK
ncbi:hypothetical protein JCM39194_17580 [Desulfotomaculum varum]